MAQVNRSFVNDVPLSSIEPVVGPVVGSTKDEEPAQRENWGRSIEFLFSCIAMSVGFGNIWKFPFVALKNGGGAFVLPYLIVLFLIGRPIYFMEMVIGQFSSRGTIKIYDFSPALRGIGIGQVIATFSVSTFYSSVLGITLKYFIDSFQSELPWAVCRESWGSCQPSGKFDSTDTGNFSVKVSASLYFTKEVIRQKDSIDDGIGDPSLTLLGYLALSWVLIFFIMIKGIKSSGKASYVLAMFPYVVLIILLIRTITLPGAWDGIAYFFTPNFKEMWNYQVWFSAVTQVFFSLNICFGCVSMYSSFNKFNHNLYRDVNIISILDTCTSLIAGSITFGVLGHVSKITGREAYKDAQGGPNLIFITYPDALAKFEVLPQLFSVIFFLMLYTLGIGSIISMVTCVMTVIRDKFPKVKNWQAALFCTCAGFSIAITYITPGGMAILDIVDFFGAQWVAFVFAIAELIAVFYVYGTNRFGKDIEFMLGFQPGIYWTACWKIITPAVMIIIFIYTMIQFEIITYNGQPYPTGVYIFGWSLTSLCLIQLPLFMVIAIYRRKDTSVTDKIRSAFKPQENWGPQNFVLKEQYDNYVVDNS